LNKNGRKGGYVLSRKHLQILKIVVIEKNDFGSINKCQDDVVNIANDEPYKISRGTVLTALKRLEYWNLVCINYEKNRSIRGSPRKFYSPTLEGVVLALVVFPELESHIDEIVQMYSDVFPEIFGKWTFFKKNGVIDFIKKRLLDGIFVMRRYDFERLKDSIVFSQILKEYDEASEEIEEIFPEVKTEEFEFFDIRRELITGILGTSLLEWDPSYEFEHIKIQPLLIKVIKKDEDLFKLFQEEVYRVHHKILVRGKNFLKWLELIEGDE